MRPRTAAMSLRTKIPRRRTARFWLPALAAATLLAAVAIATLLDGEAHATPPNSGWVTDKPPAVAYFESIHVRGVTDAEGENPQVKITVSEPTDVYVNHVTVAPGGNSGWHSHPGPSVVVIKTGTATVYDSDGSSCPATVYPAGTGFIDEGGGHVHLVANLGSAPLEVYAFQIIPHGDMRVISEPRPAGCPML